MDNIKALIARYRQTALLLFSGLILIVYISLGFVYLQQAPQQRKYEDQITRLSIILRNPLPSGDVLKAEYESVNQKLAPMTATEAIALLVSIAKESDLDITEGSGKFLVPTGQFSARTIGGISYQVLSFKGIRAQGDYDDVIAFLSVLDSGARLENMVLTRMTTEDVEVLATGAEAERRAEFRSIIAAVKEMMADNRLVRIPNPVSYRLNNATNQMGDDPLTVGLFEGFPDATTTAQAKGYTGNATPKQGYLLWQHDKINSDNTTLYSTANYTQSRTTTYYYTAEEDGTVRQFSGPSVITATEYTENTPIKMELRATVDVEIYFKPK